MGTDADTRANLLADILAHPRDDTPRAVFADWLSERDDPRGELIILQLVLAKPVVGARAYIYRLHGEERSAQQGALEARVQTLVKKHQAAWLAPMRPYVRTWQWRRGFADGFEADAAKFLEGIAVTAAHTPIAHLKLTGMKPGTLAKLCARPELVHLESLDLHEQRLGPHDAAALGAAPFEALRSLDLWGNPLGDEGLAAILGSPHLAHLERLELYKCGLTRASLATLARAPCLSTLRTLDLSNLEGADDDLGTVFARATNLRELRLGSAVLTDTMLESLAANAAFGALEHLTLPSCARSQRVDRSLRDLHTERGARAILASPHLRSLKCIVGLFANGSNEPLGDGSALAAEFRVRFGDDVI